MPEIPRWTVHEVRIRICLQFPVSLPDFSDWLLHCFFLFFFTFLLFTFYFLFLFCRSSVQGLDLGHPI